MLGWIHLLPEGEHGGGEHGPVSLLWQGLEKVSPHVAHDILPDWMLMLLLVMGGTLLFFLWLRRRLSVENPGTAQQLVELFLGAVQKFVTEVIGSHGTPYIPMVAAFGILILLSNLLGLVPGFIPPTGMIVVTLGLGLSSFLYYNYCGFKAAGPKYLKHFLGPMIFLAPLFIILEPISHLARPMSLGIRLAGNISGDHVVGEIFMSLMPVVAPTALTFLAIFVAVVQTLVFCLLTIIYIAGAVEHH